MHASAAPPSCDLVARLRAALGARSVVLVGMMGAGKSTVGRRLAHRLGLAFVDADTEIEAAAGMTIPEIFERHGEPAFRDGEARVIRRLLSSDAKVLATGGGAFMRLETRTTIRERAVSVWLKADQEVLMRRVRRRSDRPLLKAPDPEAVMRKLLAEREPIYAEAEICVPTRDVPPDIIVGEMLQAIAVHLQLPPPYEDTPT